MRWYRAGRHIEPTADRNAILTLVVELPHAGYAAGAAIKMHAQRIDREGRRASTAHEHSGCGDRGGRADGIAAAGLAAYQKARWGDSGAGAPAHASWRRTASISRAALGADSDRAARIRRGGAGPYTPPTLPTNREV